MTPLLTNPDSAGRFRVAELLASRWMPIPRQRCPEPVVLPDDGEREYPLGHGCWFCFGAFV
jgi:hypothetical protein